MATPPNPEGKKTCFVIMGFGKKTDYQTGRVLDLNKSYEYIIKPAVQDAGLECVRADEIPHSGVIDMWMYQKLFEADVVIADLSTYNCNAIYELGIRHALKPYTTITIAEKGMNYPFDVNHIAIRSYEHLGEHIDYGEARRMQAELRRAIEVISGNPQPDSPVYTYLRNLTPPEITRAAEVLAAGAQPGAADAAESSSAGEQRIAFLMQEAAAAKATGDWMAAKTFLTRARMEYNIAAKARGGDLPVRENPTIVQQLAHASYKSEQPDPISALLEARDLLMMLQPAATHDTETTGLLGAVCKRLYELDKDGAYLNEAIRCCERGFYLKNDYYNGINFAYLLNVRASKSTGDEAIADCVLARRVRTRVVQIAEGIDRAKLPAADAYWILATLEEAYLGLGQSDEYERASAEAERNAPEQWMRKTTEQQIRKLKNLLENAPCR